MPDKDMFRFSAGHPSRRRGASIAASMLDRHILTALSDAAAPLSAYDLADRLRAEGHRVVTMSVYRALHRLCACDRVQKVEMLSAYRIKNVVQPVLLICIACGATRPLPAPDVHRALGRTLAARGFVPRCVALEVAGVCADCAARGPG